MEPDRPVPPRVDESSGFRAHALPEKYNPPNTLRPNDLVKTRAVRYKENGVGAIINASDFDPEIHEDPTPAKAPAGTGAPSGAALEALTVAALTELAAERKVDLGEATRKADIIAALVAAGITTP